MNSHNKLNWDDNSYNRTYQSNKLLEEPIDAEIIAEMPVNTSSYHEDENIINLTYDPVLEPNQPIQRRSNESLSLWLEQKLTPLSTSWGLGSFSLILLSNLAIVGVQIWKLQETPPESPTATLNLEMVSPDLSIPNSLNIAKKSPDKFTLDGLSTVSNPSISPQSPQKLQKPSPIPPGPTQNVVNVNQPLSLTNAIFPPSLQPQISTPLKVPQPPKTAPLASTIPVAEIPRPLPSSIQPPPPPISSQLLSRDEQVRQMMQQQLTQTAPQRPSVTIQPPAPPVNNPPVSQNEQVRQSIKQQLNMEENNQSDIPLGFNHKTRLEMQNGINQVPSQLLPQQVKYLEQMQQREVLDSQVSPSMNIK